MFYEYNFVDQEMILVVQTDAEYLSQSSLWIKVTTLPGDYLGWLHVFFD